MGLFDRIRAAINGQKICPLEHLESYKRLGEQVYGLHVELAASSSVRALAYVQAARSLQIMADAMLGDAFSSMDGEPKPVPAVTHDQADEWYGRIPDLMIAARQEAAYAGAAKYQSPVTLGRQLEGPEPCPVEHLAGLRRAAKDMEDFVSAAASSARDNEKFVPAILLYEEARTRKQAGDSIVGVITNGRRVSAESHEDAEKQYWMALTQYILVAQGLKDPSILQSHLGSSRKRCKLDKDDIWRVTAPQAIQDISRSGEWEEAVHDLVEHWELHQISEEERDYEVTVEELLQAGKIQSDSYWYCCPFPAVYKVISQPVTVLGRRIPYGHVFVYEYGDDGAPGRFITQASFGQADSRKYCDD